jgi:hypothetical protein
MARPMRQADLGGTLVVGRVLYLGVTDTQSHFDKRTTDEEDNDL